jgi:hypothetical protein
MARSDSSFDPWEKESVVMSSATVTRHQLPELPGRALQFLSAIGNVRAIRAKMAAVGYGPDEHARGWELLDAVCRREVDFSALDSDDRVRRAIAELDEWDDPTLRRCQAALSRLHPEQEQFVFTNLRATPGAACVLVVETLLDRCDALERAPERACTREADHAALATLAARGLTVEERARVRGLVDAAKRGSVPEAHETETGATPEIAQLHAWLVDWAETARTVIARRDHLIRLGLAKKRRPEKKSDAVDVS